MKGSNQHKEIEPNKSLVLTKAFIRSAETLGMTRQELCGIIGISEASMSRVYEHTKVIEPESKTGELTLLFIRVYRSLDTLMGGNKEQARIWLRSNNFHLNGKPAELMKNIPGLNKVTLYLDAMRGKL